MLHKVLSDRVVDLVMVAQELTERKKLQFYGAHEVSEIPN